MKIISRLFTIFISSVLIITPTFATIDKDTLQFYSKNNILYYNPTGTSNCVGASSISINTSSLSTETVKKIESSKFKEAIEKNMERYIYAQNATGVPWQMLAVLHWREGGADSNKTILNGERLYDHINVDGQKVYGDPNKDAKAAAEHLLEIAKTVYNITSLDSIENIANAFLAYNRGFMYKNAGNTWDQSPYVMNYYDEQHWDMKWLHADSCNVATGKCYNHFEGTKNSQVGALPLFIYLNGASAEVGGQPTPSLDGSDVTIIGDSITFASLSELQSQLPQADISAEVGRTFETGIKIAGDPKSENSYNFKSTYEDNGQLKDSLRKNVVFALGSNSKLTNEIIQEAISTIGSNKNIYFITNYTSPDGSYSSNISNYEENNALFNSISSPNVTIIDWAKSVQSGNFLSSDGLHPNSEGQKLFAELIYNALIKTTNTTPCGSADGSTYWEGDFPFYSQCDKEWGSYEYGPNGIVGGTGYSSICAAGCGPSSFAMMATKLLNTKITPKETSDYAGKKGMHISGSGSSWEITKTLANQYGLQYEDLTWSGTMDQKIALINQKLNDGWMIHTSGSGSSPFTSGGHYIGIRGITPSGKWLIADSNGYKTSPEGNPGRENTFKEWDPKDIVVNMRHAKAIKK